MTFPHFLDAFGFRGFLCYLVSEVLFFYVQHLLENWNAQFEAFQMF